MQKGKIQWFNTEKGYGFIKQEGEGDDVFVHVSALAGISEHDIRTGMRVQFNIIESKYGIQASKVEKIHNQEE